MIQFLYDIIYTVPVCLAVISVFFPYLGMGRFFSYILSTVSGVTFVLFYHLKTRGRILLVGTCAAFAAGLFFVHRTETLSVNPKMIVVALISMGCFIIAKTADHYIRLKAALAGTALILLVFFMVNGIKPEKPAAVSVLFYILISLSEIIQIFWKKEGDTNVRKHVVCVFPFILSVMLIPMIARFPEKPYDWKFFKDIAGSIRNGYEIVI